MKFPRLKFLQWRKPKRIIKKSRRFKLKHLTKNILKFFFSLKGILLLIILTVIAGSTIFLLQTVFNDLPSPKKLSGQSFPVSTQIFDRHGILLYEIYADTYRNPVALQDLPPYVTQATIAIEDQDFYNHFGFSVQGIIRAAKNTLFSDKLQGGSTLTQQLIKTTLLTPERTIRRKLREAALTIATEIMYTKDQIIEMYLNHTPYGGTAYGIEAASQRYFNKPASELALPEAALLAGLPQAPSRYSPFLNPDQAKARQLQVLHRMVQDGYITAEQSDQADSFPLTYAPPSTDIKAPHFVMYVKSLLEEQYGLERVEKGGLRVTTTLDNALQDTAQASVSAEIESLKRYNVQNGATLITHPGTGEILAMVGSIDYFNTQNDGQVNLTNRLRQPGSSIKPLNYVTALQTKNMYPSTMIIDYPTCFKVAGTTLYCPKNYDGGFHGPVQFRQALANSYNIPAVKVLAKNTLETFIATASAMGITTFTDPSRYGLSLTLGGGEVTMLDMATAFGTIANQGVKIPLHPILDITDYTGAAIYQYDPQATQETLAQFFNIENAWSNNVGHTESGFTRILNREPAFLISDILSDNNARASAFGSNSKLRIKDQTVSVKTGTTNDLKDNWTIGYNPDYLVAVWVGNNDSTPMNPYLVSGVTGAAPIWHDLMSYLLLFKADHPQPEPPGISKTYVCNVSGVYPSDENPCDTRSEIFWEEAMPKTVNQTRKNIWVNKDTGLPAFTNTGDPNAPPVDVNNLELREHTVVSDDFVTDFCLDCPWPQDDKGRIQYPKIIVDTTKDETALGSKSDTPPQ